MSSVNIEVFVKEAVESIRYQMAGRGVRAANALRNAAVGSVLRGQRSGRVYKVPGTHGKRMSKKTQELMSDYGHKLRGGRLYRASAPGEPPAVRTGTFRNSWLPETLVDYTGGYAVNSSIKSSARTENGKYLLGELLEEGTSRMAPRPYKEKTREKALPKVMRIYREPYF